MSIDDYNDYFAQAEKDNGLQQPGILKAMALKESGGDPRADAGKNEEGLQQGQGLMQLIPSMQDAYGVDDPFDPVQSINGGAKLLADNLKRYKGDYSKALMAYNAGTNEKKFNPEYAKDVLSNINKGVKVANSNNNDPFAAARAILNEPDDGDNATTPAKKETDPFAAARAILNEPDEPTADNKKPEDEGSVGQNIAGSIMKGVGAVPQAFAYGGNLLAKLEGQAYSKYRDLKNEPLTLKEKQKVVNVEPFYTGNTIADSAANVLGGLTGDKALQEKNPVTGGGGNAILDAINYQPKTVLGRVGSAAIQGAVAAPSQANLLGAFVGGAGGAGGQAAQELYPDNPLAQTTGMLAGGLAAKGIKSNIYPTAKFINTNNVKPIAPEDAQVIKDAEDLGIETPTQAFTQKPNLKGTTNNQQYEDFSKQVNKTLVDQTGANDDGSNYTTLNKESYQNAVKNYGVNKKLIFQDAQPIAEPELGNEINSIIEDAYPSDKTFWKKTATDLQSIVDENGNIKAQDLNDFINSTSDLYKKAQSGQNDARQAQDAINKIKDLVASKLSPDDAALLKELNNKYKILNAFNDEAVGANGESRIPISTITKKLNAAYNNPKADINYNSETLRKLLNIVANGKNQEGSYSGIYPPQPKTNNNVTTPLGEAALGIVTGHAAEGVGLGLAQKAYQSTKNAIPNLLINRQSYRNALLKNALAKKN